MPRGPSSFEEPLRESASHIVAFHGIARAHELIVLYGPLPRLVTRFVLVGQGQEMGPD